MINDNEPIITEFKLSEKDYVELCRFSNLRSTKYKYLIGFLLFVVVIYAPAVIGLQMLFGSTTSMSDRDIKQNIIGLFLYALFLGYFLFMRYFGFRNHYRKHPFLGETVYKHEFHPGHITLTSTEGTLFIESIMYYPQFKNVTETKDYFFLYQTRRSKLCIPKSSMDIQQQENLRALFRALYQNRFITRR